MDNNFAHILGIFKKLEEDKTQPTGPKFGGYWDGKDKGTPKPGEGVGSMEETYAGQKKPRKGTLAWERQQRERKDYLKSFAKDPHGRLEPGDKIAGPSGTSTFSGKDEVSLEEEIMAEWEKFVEDGTITAQGAQGANTGGTSTEKTASQLAADANAIKQGLSGKLPAGFDTTKLASALASSESGKPTSPQQQAAGAGTLSKPIANIAKDPALASQLGNLLKKAGTQ